MICVCVAMHALTPMMSAPEEMKVCAKCANWQECPNVGACVHRCDFCLITVTGIEFLTSSESLD